MIKIKTKLILAGATVLMIAPIGNVVVGGKDAADTGDQTTKARCRPGRLGVDDQARRGQALVPQGDVRGERPDL